MSTITASKSKLKTTDMVNIAICAALMAVCSWISLTVMAIPFTLQTFGVFMAIGLLGGKNGTISILVYVLLGAVGLPVFSNFNGGLSALLGPTGGYIVGFLASGMVMWIIESVFGRKPIVRILAMIAGLAVCYLFGTVWFMILKGNNDMWSVLGMCVIPFIPFDLIKIALAYILSSRMRKVLHFD